MSFNNWIRLDSYRVGDRTTPMEVWRGHYAKYNTSSILIKGAVFNLKNCEILETEKTNYGYHKVVTKLSEKKVEKMKEFEEQINAYLNDNGEEQVKLVYGNRIYAKKSPSIPKKDLGTVKFRGVFINREGKSFPQIRVL